MFGNLLSVHRGDHRALRGPQPRTTYPHQLQTQSHRLLATLTIVVASSTAACNTADLANVLDEDDADSVAVIAPEVRALARENGYHERRTPTTARAQLVELGRALVFDKELSGNRDISCMTCHLPSLATADGNHIAIGQGGSGLGPDREGSFIHRNAPALLNVDELPRLFLDGRVSVTAGRFNTPAGEQLTPEMTRVFEFGALSALPLFPVESRTEMRAESGNELAALADDDFTRIWAALMTRLGGIAEYRAMFEAAYLGTAFNDMTFAHASNAIAGFLVSELSFDEAPWDRFMRGNDRAVSLAQLRGARAFLRSRCATCHRGASFSDGNFHNTALAQIGPGFGDGSGGNDDFGRFRVTGNQRDLRAFRTAPLRNIELTAPYGHAGQFAELRDFVDHYSNSRQKLLNYDITQVDPRLQGTLLDNFAAILATRSRRLNGLRFPDPVADQITAFLVALTDEEARDLTHIIPDRVPSGLSIDRRR